MQFYYVSHLHKQRLFPVLQTMALNLPFDIFDFISGITRYLLLKNLCDVIFSILIYCSTQ